MSRSYMKYLSVPYYEFEPLEWPSFRAKERRCIHKELHSVDYGDIVFPRYCPSQPGSIHSSSRLYLSKKELRDSYFREIRNVLNGFHYTEVDWRGFNDYRDQFIALFYKIKNGKDKPMRYFCDFEWLDNKKIKNAIKKWKGDPLDVIYYINRIGLIEQAVDLEAKRYRRK